MLREEYYPELIGSLKDLDRDEFLEKILKSGSSRLLKWIFPRIQFKDDMLIPVAQYATSEMFLILIEYWPKIYSRYTLYRAVQYGNLEVVNCILEGEFSIDPGFSEALLNRAISSQWFDIVKILSMSYPGQEKECLSKAVEYNNLPLVEYFLNIIGRDKLEYYLYTALDEGHVEIAELFLNMGVRIRYPPSGGPKNNQINNLLLDYNLPIRTDLFD